MPLVLGLGNLKHLPCERSISRSHLATRIICENADAFSTGFGCADGAGDVLAKMRMLPP